MTSSINYYYIINRNYNIGIHIPRKDKYDGCVCDFKTNRKHKKQEIIKITFLNINNIKPVLSSSFCQKRVDLIKTVLLYFHVICKKLYRHLMDEIWCLDLVENIQCIILLYMKETHSAMSGKKKKLKLVPTKYATIYIPILLSWIIMGTKRCYHFFVTIAQDKTKINLYCQFSIIL